MFNNSEKAYITQSFEMDRVQQHFFKEGIKVLDPNDNSHILKVLAFRDQKIGFIGTKGHDLMHSIYHKLGFGKDGTTTLAAIATERERIRLLEQNELKELKETAIAQTRAKIKELEGIIEDLQKSNTDIAEFEAAERLKLEEQLKKRITQKEKQTILAEKKKIEKSIQMLNVKELRVLAKQKGLVGYSHLRRNELLKLHETGTA